MYSTERAAIRVAVRRAKRWDEPCYVIYEDRSYHTATETDCDTFFLGALCVAAVESNGDVTTYRSARVH